MIDGNWENQAQEIDFEAYGRQKYNEQQARRKPRRRARSEANHYTPGQEYNQAFDSNTLNFSGVSW